MIEAQLPTNVSRGAVSVNDWNTQKNVLPNGKQRRIARQSKTLGKWNIDFETQDESEHIALRNFKLAVQGGAIAFRFKDWNDYKSDGQQDCSPATGNGVTTAFQLQKTYTAPSGGTSYVRTVTKPVTTTGDPTPNTVSVYKNGVLQTLTTHYTINSATGVITFVSAPAGGQTIKAVFEFDKPAVFTNDDNAETVDIDADDCSIFHHTGIEVEEVDEI